MDVMADGVGTPELRAGFDGGAGSVSRARQAAEAFLDSLTQVSPPAVPSARQDVLLAVSELVTNAVRHARTPFTLAVRLGERGVEVGVRDASRVPPRPRPPDFAGAGGFGWSLVERLSRDVRTTLLPDGKEVLVVLDW